MVDGENVRDSLKSNTCVIKLTISLKYLQWGKDLPNEDNFPLLQTPLSRKQS